MDISLCSTRQVTHNSLINIVILADKKMLLNSDWSENYFPTMRFLISGISSSYQMKIHSTTLDTSLC